MLKTKCIDKNKLEITDILKIFEYGVDYGLLIAEEERDSEDFFDAFICGSFARRTCLPSAPTARRMPRSDEWRKAKHNGLLNLIKFIKDLES